MLGNKQGYGSVDQLTQQDLIRVHTSRLPGHTTYGYFFQICQFKRKQKVKVFQDFFPESNEPSVHNPVLVTSALTGQEATNIQKVKVGG